MKLNRIIKWLKILCLLDKFFIQDMNQKLGKKQCLLFNGWLDWESVQINHSITFLIIKSKITRKEVSKLFKKTEIWLKKRLNLCCLKTKFISWRVASKCTFFVKEHNLNLSNFHFDAVLRSKTQQCDVYIHKNEICNCVYKKDCVIYSVKKRQLGDCEHLSSKYITDN